MMLVQKNLVVGILYQSNTPFGINENIYICIRVCVCVHVYVNTRKKSAGKRHTTKIRQRETSNVSRIIHIVHDLSR